jgi:hypothetical protein
MAEKKTPTEELLEKISKNLDTNKGIARVRKTEICVAFDVVLVVDWPRRLWARLPLKKALTGFWTLSRRPCRWPGFLQ